MTKINVVHSIIYYAAWFLGIILAAHGYLWLSPLWVFICVFGQVYWQSKIQPLSRAFWKWLGLVLVLSTLIDSVLIYNGVLIFAANHFAPYITAPWMIGLWFSFAIFLFTVLNQLFNQLILLSILSGLGFGFAYAMGDKMGAAFFPYGMKTAYVIGIIWLMMLPATVHCYHKFTEKK